MLHVRLPSTPTWLFDFSAGGRLGVPMFFVISGYCIANAAMRSVNAPSPLRHFLWARVHRIYPPYLCASLLAVGLSLLLTALVQRHVIAGSQIADLNLRHQSWRFWVGALTLTQLPLHTASLIRVFLEPVLRSRLLCADCIRIVRGAETEAAAASAGSVGGSDARRADPAGHGRGIRRVSVKLMAAVRAGDLGVPNFGPAEADWAEDRVRALRDADCYGSGALPGSRFGGWTVRRVSIPVLFGFCLCAAAAVSVGQPACAAWAGADAVRCRAVFVLSLLNSPAGAGDCDPGTEPDRVYPGPRPPDVWAEARAVHCCRQTVFSRLRAPFFGLASAATPAKGKFAESRGTIAL